MRRLVDRGIQTKAGAPEGALRTATIKYRQEVCLMTLVHFVWINRQATKPDHRDVGDRATLETTTPAHKPADSDVRVGNGARSRMGLGFV